MNKLAFNRALKAQLQGHPVDKIDMKYAPRFVNGTNPLEGFLLPSEVLPVVNCNADFVTLKPHVRVVPVRKRNGVAPVFDMSKNVNGMFMVDVDGTDELQAQSYVFNGLEYELKSYGTTAKVSNELFRDTKGDILKVLAEAFTAPRSANATKLILNAVAEATAEATALTANFDDVAVIDTIVTAARSSLKGTNCLNAKVVVCDSDFARLAKHKDLAGNYYIKKANPEENRFFVEGIEVLPVDDSYFTDENTEAVGGYFYVGNLNNVAFLELPNLEVKKDHKSSLFVTNSVFITGIERVAAYCIDTTAFVKVEHSA